MKSGKYIDRIQCILKNMDERYLLMQKITWIFLLYYDEAQKSGDGYLGHDRVSLYLRDHLDSGSNTKVVDTRPYTTLCIGSWAWRLQVFHVISAFAIPKNPRSKFSHSLSRVTFTAVYSSSIFIRINYQIFVYFYRIRENSKSPFEHFQEVYTSFYWWWKIVVQTLAYSTIELCWFHSKLWVQDKNCAFINRTRHYIYYFYAGAVWASKIMHDCQ